MTCALCDGQRFCLCQRLLAPPKPKPGDARARGDAPIDHALDDVQRLMDETRKSRIAQARISASLDEIQAEARRMAEALVRLIKLLEGSK